MAVTGPIPLPQTGMQAFDTARMQSQEMMTAMLNNKLNPYRQQLLEAQAAEARGKGAQSQMMANLFSLAQGGTPQGQSQGQPQPSNNGMNPNISAQPGQQVNPNTQQQAQTNLEHLGYWSPTAAEKSKMAADQAVNTDSRKRLNKESAAESAFGEKIDAMNSALNNPVYRNEVGGHLAGWGMSLPYAGKVVQQLPEHLISTAAKDAFGNANTAFGDIQSSFAARYKGAYSGKVDTLVTKMKPDIGDAIPVQDGKVAGLRVLHQVTSQRQQSIDRDINNGMSETAARAKAEKDFPYYMIEAKVRMAEKLAKEKSQVMQKQQPVQQQSEQQPNTNNQEENMNPSESNIEQGLMIVITPDGKEHEIYRNNLEAAKKKYPNLKVKKENFSAARI